MFSSVSFHSQCSLDKYLYTKYLSADIQPPTNHVHENSYKIHPITVTQNLNLHHRTRKKYPVWG